MGRGLYDSQPMKTSVILVLSMAELQTCIFLCIRVNNFSVVHSEDAAALAAQEFYSRFTLNFMLEIRR